MSFWLWLSYFTVNPTESTPMKTVSSVRSAGGCVAGAALLTSLVVLTAPPASGEEKQDPVAQAALTPVARSEISGFGVGAILGEPTGLSLKCWVNETSAVDAGFAWSFRDNSSFHLHGDYLWHNYDLIPVSEGRLPIYFGIGGRIKFEDGNDDTRAGVRFPVGLAYHFPNVPVELFVEVAPILDLTPATKFDLNGGIGVRYYFR